MSVPGANRVLYGFAGLFLAGTGLGAYWLSLGEHHRVVALMLAEGILYAAAAWWVVARGASLQGRPALLAILGAAVVARAMLLPLSPVSTDIYRYVWDGRVQASGINPYRYRPADPALAPLRDPDIYPNINRAATAVTIYPPAAQAIFLAATRLGETVTVMKAVMVAFEGLVVAALLGLLAARGLNPALILLYAWHPLPLFEFAGSGHVDAAAIGLMTAAILAADRRWPFLSGLLLGAAAAAKYIPAVVAPALYGRWDWRMPAGFCLALAVLYVPYLGAGRGVFGFLPGYVQEEGLGESGIFWLALAARLVALPAWAAPAYLAAAAVALSALGLAIAFRRWPDRISLEGALSLAAALLIAVTPHYPWYFALLVPLLCFRPSVSLVWLTCASPLVYGIVWPFDRFACEVLLYGPFVAIVSIEAFRSNALARETGHGRRFGHQPAG